MKRVLLAMLLAVFQASYPIPGKAPDSAAGGSQGVQKDATNEQNPTTPPLVINPIASPKPKNPTNEPPHTNTQETVVIREPVTVPVGKDWWDRAYIVFTGFLVLIGGIGVVAAFRTLKIIERQTKSIHHQAVQVRKQTRILNKSASAAQKAAEAALLNAQAVINAERAWIVVEIIQDRSASQFRSVAMNYGRTPAQLVGYNIQRSFAFSDADLPPEPPQYSESPSPEGQPFLVTEEEWTIESFSVDRTRWSFPETAKHPMLYWGVLRYRDIVGNMEHDTWFCLRLDPRERRFVIAGPPKYNSYT